MVEVAALPVPIRVEEGPMPPEVKPSAAPPPASPVPQLTPALTAMLPQAMEELMREFVNRKDLNTRVAIKFRMKALLDFAAADTEYPPNPLLKPEAPTPARMAAFAQDSGMNQSQGPGGGVGTADILT